MVAAAGLEFCTQMGIGLSLTVNRIQLVSLKPSWLKASIPSVRDPSGLNGSLLA